MSDDDKTPPSGTPDVPRLDDFDEESIASWPQNQQEYVKQLRYEAKTNRLKAKELKENLSQVQQRLDVIETERKTTEQKKLEEKQEYETLKARLESDRVTTIAAANKVAIDAKLESAAVAKGLSPKAILKLVERNGISIDSTGNVSGIETAIERALEDHADILVKAPAPAAPTPVVPSGNGTPETPPTPNGDLLDRLMPGTNMTYRQIQNGMSMGNGNTPSPTPDQGKPANKRLDFESMKPAERAKWEKDYFAKLKTR